MEAHLQLCVMTLACIDILGNSASDESISPRLSHHKSCEQLPKVRFGVQGQGSAVQYALSHSVFRLVQQGIMYIPTS